MSIEHGLPTASVVRSSQATPARRRGQSLHHTAIQTAADPLISARIVFEQAEPRLTAVLAGDARSCGGWPHRLFHAVCAGSAGLSARSY